MTIQLVKKERKTNEMDKTDRGDHCDNNFEKAKIEIENFLRENLSEELETLTEESPEIIFTKYLWVIKLLEEKLEGFKTTAYGFINQTERWLERKESQITNQVNYLLNQMQNYLQINNQKSLSLPTGIVGFRKQPSKLEIKDLSLFLKNAKEELLRKIPECYEPDLMKIKSYIKETGDIPLGIELINQDPKFYYKINTEEETRDE